MGFLKIVHFHEIICHYSRTNIHSNDKEFSLSNPEKTFVGFKPMKKYSDLTKIHYGPYKNESILFLNKIKYIFQKELYSL